MNRRPLEVSYIPTMPYGEAWELQKEIVQALDQGSRQEALLLLQHPPTYTIGSQRHPEHLLLSTEQLEAEGISVFEIDRGGDITYHGPGQLVGYPLLMLGYGQDLDLHGYLRSLEQVIIDLLGEYGLEGTRKPSYTGVWIGDRKIAAIGVKFNRCKHRRGFITSHGFAFNVEEGVEQDGFSGIVPCGIQDYGVISLEGALGQSISVEQVAQDILPHFVRNFPYDIQRIHS